MAERLGPRLTVIPNESLRLLRARLTEADFLAEVTKRARLFGYAVYHTHRSEHSAAGFPDLVLVKGPRLIFAEFKREGGQPTPAQQGWLDALEGCDAPEVYLWRPSQLEELTALLQRQPPGC